MTIHSVRDSYQPRIDFHCLKCLKFILLYQKISFYIGLQDLYFFILKLSKSFRSCDSKIHSKKTSNLWNSRNFQSSTPRIRPEYKSVLEYNSKGFPMRQRRLNESSTKIRKMLGSQF